MWVKLHLNTYDSIKRESGWNCGVLVNAYTTHILSRAARMGDAGSITAYSVAFAISYLLPFLIKLRCSWWG